MTTDDARLLEIEARYGGKMAVFTRGRERIEISVELLSPFLNVAIDVRYLLYRLKAAESRIRELRSLYATELDETLVSLGDAGILDLYQRSRIAIEAGRRFAGIAQSDEVQEDGNGVAS